MEENMTGGCLCGAVEFSIQNEFKFLLFCHCEQCRRISGSAHASNLFSETNSLTWLKGEENIQHFDFPGRDFPKVFCKTCGCGLPFRSKNLDLDIVPAGSLHSEPSYLRQAKVFLAECPDWVRTGSETKHFEGYPDFFHD